MYQYMLISTIFLLNNLSYLSILSEQQTITSINMWLVIYCVTLSIICLIGTVLIVLYAICFKLSDQPLWKLIVGYHCRNPRFCLVYIGIMIFNVLLIGLKLWCEGKLQVKSQLEIHIAINLCIVVILYSKSTILILKNTHYVRKVSKNIFFKCFVEMAIWNLGMISFSIFQIMVFDFQNSITLATLNCLCSYNFLDAGIKSFRVNQKIWLTLWIIPASILTGFILDIVYIKNYHFFFGKFRYFCGLILFCLLMVYFRKAYLTICKLYSQYRAQKVKRQQKEQYMRRLFVKISVCQDTKNYRVKILPNEQCSICMVQDQQDQVQLKCGHFFHPRCILIWVNMSFTCPICRAGKHIIV